jgi:adenylate cyclase
MEPTILVVDDNEDSRNTLTLRLKSSGYCTVLTAENGRQGLDIIRARPIDLVLLDIMMPEVDGYRVLEVMRADPTLRTIPVLVVSAVDDMASVVKCIKLGATDYLVKPFNAVLLKARIDFCIDQLRLRALEATYQKNLESEKRRADGILATVLPREVVRALKTGGLQPQLYDNVAVLFCDIVGFTAYSERESPEKVFRELEELIERFETIASRHGLEKIKTVGDAFVATAGLLAAHDNPVHGAVAAALEMVSAGQAFGPRAGVRAGIDHGPVLAGIMGKQQFQFDVWGDAVNSAKAIEASARPGSVWISGRAWVHLRDRVDARSCGLFELKGKETMELFECIKLKD